MAVSYNLVNLIIILIIFGEANLKLVEDESHRWKLVINILVLIIGLRGVSESDARSQKVSLFERLMIDMFAPMQKSVTYIKDQSSSFFDHYLTNVSASKENELLKKKIEELQSDAFSHEEIAGENTRLKELLGFGKKIPAKKILAQVVAWDSSSDFKVIRINKGIDDKIKLQAPVVTAQGLVGYVYRLTNHFADILTILDSNNRVDGIIKRIRSHGIVEGYSGNKCIMKYVARTEPVILNDLVLTSGFGNIYPKGLRVGTVSKIERESYGITQEIEIKPSVDFGRLEEVIVLNMSGDVNKEIEWKALDDSSMGEK